MFNNFECIIVFEMLEVAPVNVIKRIYDDVFYIRVFTWEESVGLLIFGHLHGFYIVRRAGEMA